MKALVLVVLFLGLPFLSLSQDRYGCYEKRIAEGREMLKSTNKDKYKLAIQKFNSARRCDPSKSDLVDLEIDKVFEFIIALKEEADDNLKTANRAKFNEEIAKIQAQSALNDANSAKRKEEDARELAEKNLAIADSARRANKKIVDAFYFYHDRFAIAQKLINGQKKYGFINKKGDPVIDYVFDEVTQFSDADGLAIVKQGEKRYLLDTLKNQYFLPTTLDGITGQTTAVDLRSKELDSIPIAIFKLSSLISLDLSGNQLKSLPDQIGQLTSLTSLYLSGNQLRSLPPGITKLTNLTSLDLHENQLTSLPPQIVELKNLTSLNLSGNSLDNLLLEIGQLQNLTRLYLSRNKLTSLLPEIARLKSLTRLDLSFNSLDSLPPDIGQLAHLTSLNLSYNQLTSLPPEIVQLKSLTLLYLIGNPIPKDTKSEIRKLLPWVRIDFDGK